MVTHRAAVRSSRADADAWRLLTQATFGPSPADMAQRVQDAGHPAKWIDDQFTQPISGYPDSRYNHIQLKQTPDCTTTDPATMMNYPASAPQAQCVRDHLTLNMIQRDFFTNAVTKGDQLRQRVAWALSQILVTSAVENDLSYAYVMSRYQNLMFNNAFGNYETLLQQITLSPAMGNYLDQVNNDRASGTRVPNENYAREIMQLFSIGLEELNDDGSYLTDDVERPHPDVRPGRHQGNGAGVHRLDVRHVRRHGHDQEECAVLRGADGGVSGHDHHGPRHQLQGCCSKARSLPATNTPLQDIQGAVHATCSCTPTRPRSSASS